MPYSRFYVEVLKERPIHSESLTYRSPSGLLPVRLFGRDYGFSRVESTLTALRAFSRATPSAGFAARPFNAVV